VGNRWWAVLFGGMMFLCGALFVVAPIVGWWMPRGDSTHAAAVDFLFYIILYVTGFFFILTEALLVIFMFRYASRPDGALPTAEPTAFDRTSSKLLGPLTRYINSPHRVELAWTIVPAVILLYIAFAQVGAWAKIKYYSQMPQLSKSSIPLQVGVSARQFEWRMRYPSHETTRTWLLYNATPAELSAQLESLPSLGRYDTNKDGAFDEDELKAFRKQIDAEHRAFARTPQADEVHIANDLHIHGDYYVKKGEHDVPATKDDVGAYWKADRVLVQLSTLDVIHSFNIPNMRVKQDALPGKTIAVWFAPTIWNTKKQVTGRWEDGFSPLTGKPGDNGFIWDIPCAELCGWGHYRMIGRLYVHETQQDYLAWLKEAEEQGNAHSR